MSPEYALDGCFSLKSDVFSFGVILLEIVSGKKNRGFFHTDHQLNLLGHVSINNQTEQNASRAWKLTSSCEICRHGSFGMKEMLWS